MKVFYLKMFFKKHHKWFFKFLNLKKNQYLKVFHRDFMKRF